MSSFGSFGGFGQPNNQSSSFGFGANTNTSGTGFGSGGFGSNSNNPSGGNSLFGGGSTSGFGSGGGFGSTTNSSFGAKTAGFGSTTASSGTGLFGSNSGTSGSTGGFGFGNNSSSTAGFGTGSSGGLFSSGNKAAGFGSTGTTGGSIFGGGSSGTTGGSFGSGTSTGFGSTGAGLGGNVGDPPGTGVVAFSPLQEKEPNNTTNVFQNLLFQDPYKKWSADELRLADYAQGRKHGNASGAGAFGVGSGFGGSSFSTNQTSSGFGSGTTSTGSTLFGSGSNPSSGFGSTNANTAGFGSGGSGGGGLFGQKPASGGIFGNNTQPTTGSTFGSGGFGNTATTTGGFSSGNTTSTGGGLFGSNAQQNKPGGFGGFGSGTTTSGFGSNNQTGSFGGASTTGGSLFGSNQSNNPSGGGLFGNNQNQSSTTTGGFGVFGNQNQPQNTGGALFGNNQQKPSGLFGSTNASTGTGGGLFGNASNTTSSGFGSANTTSTGGGLFGNAAKPTTAGTGLFGSSTTAQNTGTSGSLFGQGNPNQQQNSSGSLFGSNQPKPSLFGGSTTQNTGSVFGSQPGNPPSSLFGSTTTQQQPQQSTFGASLFGASQNQQASQQQPLTTSINDVSAFGSTSLFANLGANDVQNPGPLATPLTNKNKPRKSSILPMYKLNPASASRYATPQKRGGFGFSYSTYGTPGSASSVSSTPGGFNQNLLMGSTSRGLSKSMSATSLRRSFNTEDTILNPGVFSAGNGQRYGSVKKLVINREMRSDLFSTPQKDKQTPESSKVPKKHVTFEEAGSSNGDATSTALVVADSQANSGSASPSGSSRADRPAPEVQPPSQATEVPPITIAAPAGSDPRPGTRWMKPRKEEIERMSRTQRQAVEGFTVGRVNVGSVKFLPPVDLTDVDLDTLFENIVLLETRSATVYPDPAKKPPVGKGLNVPAEISLEQSWPRAKDKRTVDTASESRVRKHMERLKRIPDTTFINYDKLTGVWTFRVEHFTTYGLEYEDESDTEATNVTVDASAIPPTTLSVDSESSPNNTDPDDTFEFRGKRRILPGAFDTEFEEDPDTAMEISRSKSFLADRSAGSTSNALVPIETENEVQMGEEYDVAEGSEVASPSPSSHLTAEPQFSSPEQDRLSDVETPGGIMRARMRAIKDSATPMKIRVADGDDWMDMLQRTISPQKRDRVLLKSINADENYPSLRESIAAPMMTKPPVDGRGFATSIDLMNSLFEKAKVPPSEPPMGSRGFVKWPYQRQKKNMDEKDMNPTDQAFHQSMRPSWGPDGTIVFATTPRSLGRSSYRTPEKSGILSVMKGAVSSEDRDVRIAKFSSEPSAKALREQIRITRCERDANGVPTVRLAAIPRIKSFFQEYDAHNPAAAHEKLVWELASILFDDVQVPATLKGQPGVESRLRREGVSRFWQSLVEGAVSRCISMAKSNEEKAVAALSGHRIPDACKHLLDGKDFRLATLVSVIGTNYSAKADMAEQMKSWQDGKFLSEFTEPIRALYSLLAGEVHSCSGKEIGPVEDRIRPFLISERFGLDWKQAFGLRLWYASSSIEDVAVAVNRFEADLEKGEACPRTWYSEQGIAPIWQDTELDTREDLLWGLLKLYANQNADLEAILRPENSQLSPLDFRLSWQLGRALVASGKLTFGTHADEKADAATVSFASQLCCEGSWLEATFVLLHLSNPDSRTQAIKEHLARHAASIGEEHSESFRTLVADLQIPQAWVWEAKALYMRSVKKMPDLEVHYLLRALAFNDAHQTLIQRVAPQAIIERDYASLADLLSEFAGHEGRISDWRLGGEVYRDFIRLVSLQNRPDQISEEFVEKLLGGLALMQVANQGSSDMEQLAALTEMGSIVARIVIKSGMVHEPSSILSLPLTEDGYLRHSMDMSLAYYSELMAGGATAGY